MHSQSSAVAPRIFVFSRAVHAAVASARARHGSCRHGEGSGLPQALAAGHKGVEDSIASVLGGQA